MLINVSHNRDIIIYTLLILFFVVHSHQSTSPKSGDKPEPKRCEVVPDPFFLSHTQRKKGSGYVRLSTVLVGNWLVFALQRSWFSPSLFMLICQSLCWAHDLHQADNIFAWSVDLTSWLFTKFSLPMYYFADSPKFYTANVSCYMVQKWTIQITVAW